MNTVSFELIQKIRGHINRTAKQARLLENLKKWQKLCSALDVLEDTSWAIEYYCNSEYPEEIRGKYLHTYGLLQALFVQEDAVLSINDALFGTEIDLKSKYPKAYAVREMRNDVIGHPTSRSGDKFFVHLSQISMSKMHFQYLKYGSQEETTEVININVMEAIEDVAKCINDILTLAVNDLDKEFKAYVEMHKKRKMKDIFQLLEYASEKVFTDQVLGDVGYANTKKMVQECENELIARYGTLNAVDSFEFLLEEIHEIYALIDNGVHQIPGPLQNQFKKYIMQCLFHKLRTAENYCEEIDRDFENGGEDDIEEAPMDKPRVVISYGEEELRD